MGIYQTVYNCALKLKEGTELLTYGRDIIKEWAVSSVNNCKNDAVQILDIGCGKGVDLINIKSNSNKTCKLHGIEFFDEYIQECNKKGISIANLNIERDKYPFQDEFFDVIIANQIIEHTKDTFYMISEISRILKKGGTLIIGIPNLAAYHDRLILLLGQQPSGCKMLGPHIRGITKPALTQFMECEGFFKFIDFKGSGFYPFPTVISKMLAKTLPSLATSIFFKFRRTEENGQFIEVLNNHFYETNYYRG